MKNTAVADKKSAETQTNDSSVPVWKAQHKRVQGAMWKHLQADGKARYTVSLARSYKDKDDGKWKNVHYFDRNDLTDLVNLCAEAEEEILKCEGMATQAGDD